VDDIDLFVGGFLEQNGTESILGPVFRCILHDTFRGLKFGDRFWYESGNDTSTRFSLSELKEIRKVTMSRIICDNTEGLNEMQPYAFESSSSEFNQAVSCQDVIKIPRLDISPFNGVDVRTSKVNCQWGEWKNGTIEESKSGQWGEWKNGTITSRLFRRVKQSREKLVQEEHGGTCSNNHYTRCCYDGVIISAWCTYDCSVPHLPFIGE